MLGFYPTASMPMATIASSEVSSAPVAQHAGTLSGAFFSNEIHPVTKKKSKRKNEEFALMALM